MDNIFTIKKKMTKGVLSGLVICETMRFVNFSSAKKWAKSINNKKNVDYKIIELYLGKD